LSSDRFAQEDSEPGAPGWVAGAGPVEKSGAVGGGSFDYRGEERLVTEKRVTHATTAIANRIRLASANAIPVSTILAACDVIEVRGISSGGFCAGR
jgi:hypothetical protein